ncbi:MAG: extracellular solute-binding protein [Breznakia sp.]
MKKIVIGLLVVTLFLLTTMIQDEKDSIIIYSSLEQFRGDAMQEALNKEFPEKDIRVMYISTAKSASKISVEKDKNDADIVAALESSYLIKVEEQLADIEGISKLNYVDGLTLEDNNNRFVTWERQAGAFVIRQEILDKYGLEAPKTYDDLLDKKYKGLIAMPDPKSSGTGYFFYKSVVNERGEEAALTYFRKLEKNIKQFTESGSGPMKLLIQGEVGIALSLTFQGVNEINNNMPFTIIFPEIGSPFSITGTALMKRSQDNEDVREVYSYLINEFIKVDKEKFSPEQIFVGQINTIPNYPKNIPYADMRGIGDIKEKERLLGLWEF